MRLNKGQKFEVPGKAIFILQNDNNLCLYGPTLSDYKWDSKTNGKTVTHAIMQPDGNFVIYNNTTPVWASNTWNVGAEGGYLEIDVNTYKMAIYKANGTQAKLLSAGTGTSQNLTTWVKFKNTGEKQVEVWQSNASGIPLGETAVAIVGNLGEANVPAKVGDHFLIKTPYVATTSTSVDPFSYHPKIVITDLSETVFIYGNVPANEFASWSNMSEELILPDYDPNHAGIDLRALNPRNLVNTINKGQIFEKLDAIKGVDYKLDSGKKLIKYGFTFAGMNIGEGSSSEAMNYGYNSFSRGFSGSIGGSAPVKGAQVSASIGFNMTESTENTEQNVYAYAWDQKQVFNVTVDPNKARLDPAFRDAVLRINSKQDAMAFIGTYGTSFPLKVVYGGDRSYYLEMKQSDYSKAKSYGVDVKAAVSMSAMQKTGKTTSSFGTRYKYKNQETESGSLGFSYSQDEKVQEVMQNTKSKYRFIGGTGGFEDWSVDEGNASPIAVEIGPITDLINIKVFKDGTPSFVLDQKRAYIQQALDEYLAGIPNLGQPRPAPIVYELELKSFEVTRAANEDANKGLKGHSNVVFNHNGKNTTLNMWQQDTYVDPWTTLCFCPGKEYKVPGGKKVYFTQFPEANHTFSPLTIDVHANFWEMDDNLADNTDYLYGHQGPFPFPVTKLADGASTELNFSVYQDGKLDWNSIRVKYKITRLLSEFTEIRSGI
jgi:hypothetical protein